MPLMDEILAALPTDRDRADRALDDAVSAYADNVGDIAATFQATVGIGYAMLAIREQLERIGDQLEDPPTYGPLQQIAELLGDYVIEQRADRAPRPGLLRRMAGWLR